MKKEVREGYKMTDLGEIPNKWSVKKLKDVGYSVIGLTYSPDDLVGKEDGILVLRSSNIKNGRISYDDNKYVNKIIAEKQIVKKDDILICSRNGSKELIGKCAIIDEKAEGSSFGAFMTVFRSDYNKYLFHVFNSYLFKRQIYNNIGATINQITTDNLNNFKVIIPTNDEQEKISLILSTIDAQIDNTEKLIQKNQELKKGLMQQLLTKGIGHTEFKKTEFGDIPDIWEIKKLSELANVIDSLHETPEYSEQGYPMIRVVDVNGKEINTKYTKFVSKDVFDKFTKKYIPRKNDIIMSRVGSYGQVSYLETDEKVCLGQNTVVITTDFDKKYIFYALSSNYVKNNIEKVTSGSSQKTLSLANIKDLKLLLPRIEEQNKIVAILSSIDEKIDKYQSKKIRLEEIKKGLMQQLLTGKIRVVL
ncbi:restriction endonuclease subunit S [Clostridium perfringens]|uniref:restriction endonuclease subunit S n=1 Tax=Clostridium perfringens TaxID=1502 RepID=UPI0039E98328